MLLGKNCSNNFQATRELIDLFQPLLIDESRSSSAWPKRFFLVTEPSCVKIREAYVIRISEDRRRLPHQDTVCLCRIRFAFISWGEFSRFTVCSLAC